MSDLDTGRKVAASPPEKAPQTLARHGAGFLLSGLISFSVDAAMLHALTRLAGLDPFSARLLAIAVAMIAGWLAHRRWTFVQQTPPSLPEFLRYAALAWSAAAINYTIYALILIARADLEPFAALVGATIVAMGFSYLGMRFGVFARKP